MNGFLLAFALSVCDKTNGLHHCLRSDAALTKAPHKEMQWLTIRAHQTHAQDRNSPKSKTRSLKSQNSTLSRISTASPSVFRIRPQSLSAWSRVFSLSCFGRLDGRRRENHQGVPTSTQSGFHNVNTELARHSPARDGWVFFMFTYRLISLFTYLVETALAAAYRWFFRHSDLCAILADVPKFMTTLRTFNAAIEFPHSHLRVVFALNWFLLMIDCAHRCFFFFFRSFFRFSRASIFSSSSLDTLRT